MMRFKTEEEFLEEYGSDWMHKVEASWDHRYGTGGGMDHFFGVHLSTREESLMRMHGRITKESWTVTMDMVTEEVANTTEGKAVTFSKLY